MSGPNDITLDVGAGPKALSIFLGDISAYFRGELAARGGDLVLPRGIAKLFDLGFREATYRAEILEESQDVCGRLEARHRLQEAEIARLKRLLAQSGRSLVGPVDGLGKVVDLTEAFARERCSRAPGNEGGAA